MLTALIATVMLRDQSWYALLLIAQCGCYAAGIIGWIFQCAGVRSALFGPFLMFLTLNLTTTQALWDACRSRYQVTWRKTPA